MTVSVVIPVRNGESTIGAQLDALAAQTFLAPFDVLVVDNGSTDRTVDVAETFSSRLPGLQVVDGSARIGINAARNQGLSIATGDVVLICDADDVVGPDWVRAMAASLEAFDIVGGALDEQVLNPGAAQQWRPAVPLERLPMALDFLPYAIGANVGLRREVAERLGGFDEAYVRGGADVEFSWRAQLEGFRLGHCPAAVVAYRHRPDIRSTMRQAYRFGMADVQLYRAFRSRGLRRPALRPELRSWWALIVNVPYLFHSSARRGDWCRRAAYRGGRIRASARDRILFP